MDWALLQLIATALLFLSHFVFDIHKRFLE